MAKFGDPIINPYEYIFLHLVLPYLLNIAFGIPVLALVITTVVASILFFVLVKKFRKNNSIIVQIIGIGSTFLFPVSLFVVVFIRVGRLLGESKWCLVGDSFCFIPPVRFLWPICHAFFELVPVLAFIAFYWTWFILYIKKVGASIFPKKEYFTGIVVAQIIISVLAIVIFPLLKMWPVVIMTLISPEFELTNHQGINVGTLLLAAIVDLIVMTPGCIMFFGPLAVVAIFSFKAKKLDLMGLMVVIQALDVFTAALLLSHSGAELVDMIVYTTITALNSWLPNILKTYKTFGGLDYSFLNYVWGFLSFFGWTIIIFVVVIEFFMLMFVYAQKLGSSSTNGQQMTNQTPDSEETQF